MSERSPESFQPGEIVSPANNLRERWTTQRRTMPDAVRLVRALVEGHVLAEFSQETTYWGRMNLNEQREFLRIAHHNFEQVTDPRYEFPDRDKQTANEGIAFIEQTLASMSQASEATHSETTPAPEQPRETLRQLFDIWDETPGKGERLNFLRTLLYSQAPYGGNPLLNAAIGYWRQLPPNHRVRFLGYSYEILSQTVDQTERQIYWDPIFRQLYEEAQGTTQPATPEPQPRPELTEQITTPAPTPGPETSTSPPEAPPTPSPEHTRESSPERQILNQLRTRWTDYNNPEGTRIKFYYLQHLAGLEERYPREYHDWNPLWEQLSPEGKLEFIGFAERNLTIGIDRDNSVNEEQKTIRRERLAETLTRLREQHTPDEERSDTAEIQAPPEPIRETEAPTPSPRALLGDTAETHPTHGERELPPQIITPRTDPPGTQEFHEEPFEPVGYEELETLENQERTPERIAQDILALPADERRLLLLGLALEWTETEDTELIRQYDEAAATINMSPQLNTDMLNLSEADRAETLGRILTGLKLKEIRQNRGVYYLMQWTGRYQDTHRSQEVTQQNTEEAKHGPQELTGVESQKDTTVEVFMERMRAAGTDLEVLAQEQVKALAASLNDPKVSSGINLFGQGTNSLAATEGLDREVIARHVAGLLETAAAGQDPPMAVTILKPPSEGRVRVVLHWQGQEVNTDEEPGTPSRDHDIRLGRITSGHGETFTVDQAIFDEFRANAEVDPTVSHNITSWVNGAVAECNSMSSGLHLSINRKGYWSKAAEGLPLETAAKIIGNMCAEEANAQGKTIEISVSQIREGDDTSYGVNLRYIGEKKTPLNPDQRTREEEVSGPLEERLRQALDDPSTPFEKIAKLVEELPIETHHVIRQLRQEGFRNLCTRLVTVGNDLRQAVGNPEQLREFLNGKNVYRIDSVLSEEIEISVSDLALEEELKRLLQLHLETERRHLRELLIQHGIERIEATAGADLIPGQIEADTADADRFVETTDPNLDGKYFDIYPGQGGYRIRRENGTYDIIQPTHARTYQLRKNETDVLVHPFSCPTWQELNERQEGLQRLVDQDKVNERLRNVQLTSEQVQTIDTIANNVAEESNFAPLYTWLRQDGTIMVEVVGRQTQRVASLEISDNGTMTQLPIKEHPAAIESDEVVGIIHDYRSEMVARAPWIRPFVLPEHLTAEGRILQELELHDPQVTRIFVRQVIEGHDLPEEDPEAAFAADKIYTRWFNLAPQERRIVLNEIELIPTLHNLLSPEQLALLHRQSTEIFYREEKKLPIPFWYDLFETWTLLPDDEKAAIATWLSDETPTSEDESGHTASKALYDQFHAVPNAVRLGFLYAVRRTLLDQNTLSESWQNVFEKNKVYSVPDHIHRIANQVVRDLQQSDQMRYATYFDNFENIPLAYPHITEQHSLLYGSLTMTTEYIPNAWQLPALAYICDQLAESGVNGVVRTWQGHLQEEISALPQNEQEEINQKIELLKQPQG